MLHDDLSSPAMLHDDLSSLTMLHDDLNSFMMVVSTIQLNRPELSGGLMHAFQLARDGLVVVSALCKACWAFEIAFSKTPIEIILSKLKVSEHC